MKYFCNVTASNYPKFRPEMKTRVNGLLKLIHVFTVESIIDNPKFTKEEKRKKYKKVKKKCKIKKL